MFKIQTGEKNTILRQQCLPVEKFDKNLIKIVEEMVKTMLEPDPETEIRGVGLAANQCGLDRRIILVTFNVGTNKEYKVITMINPEIVSLSKNEVMMEEGCLSLPGLFKKVSRSQKVHVRWQNEKGNFCEKRLNKWDARIFLHEFDHLEGKLFVDYLNK